MKAFYKYSLLTLTVVTIATAVLFLSQTLKQQPQNEDYNKAFSFKYSLYSPPLPDSIIFAGEKVPLNQYDVREALDREMLVNLYWQSNLLLYFKRAYRYFPVIEPILKENKIPNDFKYLALIESGLANVVSPSKAAGFWQFLQATGTSYGLEINSEIDERYHLEKATQAACDYLNKSYKQHGSWSGAAAAYNMGDGGFRRTATNQKNYSYWDLYLNPETARYMYRILAVKIIFENPEKYGIILRLKDLYQPIPSYKLSVDTTIANLTDFALQQGISYKTLKDFNPWLRGNSLPNRSRKTYEISIPEKDYLYYDKQIENIQQFDIYKGEK
ncbi:MAG: lytic transglycosylase domain-containing protein [Bacteroidales bacterium]|nr:lytic transglycosylase domain-containing protein [Bacteroidales bacterium]